MLTRFVRTAALALFTLTAGSCSSLGGASFLVFGGSHSPQGDLVARARSAEHETQELRTDYAAAFHLYQRLTSPQAVQLQQLSEEFEDSVEGCEDRAQDLSERVESIRRETDVVVENWTTELARFSSDAVRKKSEAQMRDTEAYAQRLQAAAPAGPMNPRKTSARPSAFVAPHIQKSSTAIRWTLRARRTVSGSFERLSVMRTMFADSMAVS